MRRRHLIACGAAVATLVCAPSAGAKPDDVNSSKLERAVTVEGILQHQKALQTIATSVAALHAVGAPMPPMPLDVIYDRARELDLDDLVNPDFFEHRDPEEGTAMIYRSFGERG